MDTYVYQIDDNLYVNLTNKCSNACIFCVRNGKDSYYGNKLWIDKEPTAQEVIQILEQKEFKKFNEVVFCGFGEPTYRLAELIVIGRYVKSKGGKVRLNTNGHGNLINGRDITKELSLSVDKINVSLNAGEESVYLKQCNPLFDNAYDKLKEFALSCKQNGIDTVFSIVDSIGEEQIEKCKKISNELGIPLRIRQYIQDS